MNTSGRVAEGKAQVRLRLTTMVVEGPAAKTKRARRGMMMATMRAVGGRWTSGARGSGSGGRLGRRRLVLWVWMKKGRQGVGEQPRSALGCLAASGASKRAEGSTNVTMAAGGGDNRHRRTYVRIKKRKQAVFLAVNLQQGLERPSHDWGLYVV